MTSLSQRAIEISLTRRGTEQLAYLPQQDGDMARHRLVTCAVTLPVIIKTFDRVFQ